MQARIDQTPSLGTSMHQTLHETRQHAPQSLLEEEWQHVPRFPSSWLIADPTEAHHDEQGDRRRAAHR